MKDQLIKRLRNYVRTWPTSIPGVILIVHGASGIIVCLSNPDCGIESLSKHWDDVMQALMGLGLLEARNITTRSEDIS